MAKQALQLSEPLLQSAADNAAAHVSTVDVAPTAEAAPDRDAAPADFGRCAVSVLVLQCKDNCLLDAVSDESALAAG